MKPTNQKTILGVVPIIPTPFDVDEAIDEEALCRMVEFAVGAGFAAICLPAYGSEFYKLSDEERTRVVEIAVGQSAGRLPVIAQSNHGSARIARSLAQSNVERGANLISIAIPRQFNLSDDDLLRYLIPILNAVDVPCLVQDFNPGGVTVSLGFITRLLAECANFRYLKLEEPLLAPKVRAIREATGNQVGVLEGWGGLYTLELIPAGICGLMPGLGIADILNQVFFLRKNNSPVAFDLFEAVLPQICFALQNLELFLYCEKRLLEGRGILTNARCRTPAYSPDPDTVRYVDELNGRTLQKIAQLGLPGMQTWRSDS